jgi:hypothetical protein
LKDKKSTDYKKVAKYLNIPFQMAAILGLGTWGGLKLDKLLGTNFPIFTLILIFISLFLAIYIVIKDLIK